MTIKGVWAELAAVRYLRRMHVRVIRTRYRARGGEIDLIARDGAVTALIEVKSAPRLGEGAARVDTVKRARLRKAAEQYMRETGETNIRFDILEESDAGFRYIRGAF